MYRRVRATLRAFTLRRVSSGMLLLSLAAACVCAGAQTAVDGAIRGDVKGAGGEAIPLSEIRATGRETAIEFRTVTDSRGEFVLTRVPPGEYDVRVEAKGFQPELAEGLVVEVGGVAGIEARLVVANRGGGAGLSAANAPVNDLEDASATVSTKTSDTGELESLPLNGKLGFAELMPAASEDDTGDGLLSFGGLAAAQNRTTVDGMSDDQSFNSAPRGTGGDAGRATEDEIESGFSSGAGRGRAFGVGTARRMGAVSTFAQEAVREFRVSVQNYSAAYGHGAGGSTNTVSRSGTNVMHGSGFYLARRSAWGAANPYDIATSYNNGVVTGEVVKPNDLRQQFGGSVGGPLMRDRLFYFYTLDLLRRNFPAISSPQYAGFYSLTATQRALLGNRGVSTTKINAALNYLSGLTGTIPRQQNQDINFVKVDWQSSKFHRVSVAYNRARMDAPAGAREGAVVDRGLASMGSSHVDVDSVVARWLWAWSASGSNEMRGQYGRDLQYETAQTPLAQEAAIGPDGYAPQVSIGPQGLIFGTPATLGRKAYPDERRLAGSDLVTWGRGRHLIQLGGEFSAVHDEIDSLSNTDGTFNYDSGVTNGKAGGLVDWITDYSFDVHAYPNGACPSIVAPIHNFCFRSYTQSFGQQTVAFDTQEWAVFAEEGWRVRRGLSVKIGARYEYELLPLPQRPNAALDAAFGAVGATSSFPEDRNNIGGRMTIAWEPFGAKGGMVRMGYGQYFGRVAGGTIRSALLDTALPSSATHVRIVPTTVTLCPQVANQGFGYVCSYVTTPPAAVAVTTAAMVFDRKFRLPAVQQGSFALEHSLGHGVMASATYLMSLDRQLPDSVDINIAHSTATAFQLSGGSGVPGITDGYMFRVPVYTQRVSTSFGPVTDIESNGNATYNALVLEVRRRTRKALEFRVGWTWGKAIDFGQTGGAVPRTNGQFDPFNVGYNKGLSSFGHSHRLVASAVWEPRIAEGARWVRQIANGWGMAPVFTEASGRPYSYNIFGGNYLSGGRESINGSGGAVYLPTVGRNTLRLPDTMNVNLRVSRVVKISDRVRVRATVDAFNLANHVNISAVTQRAFLAGTAMNGVTPLVFQSAAAVAAAGSNVRAFGTPTAAGTDAARQRQVQIGIRVEF